MKIVHLPPSLFPILMGGFLPKLLFEIMWKVTILIMSSFSVSWAISLFVATFEIPQLMHILLFDKMLYDSIASALKFHMRMFLSKIYRLDSQGVLSYTLIWGRCMLLIVQTFLSGLKDIQDVHIDLRRSCKKTAQVFRLMFSLCSNLRFRVKLFLPQNILYSISLRGENIINTAYILNVKKYIIFNLKLWRSMDLKMKHRQLTQRDITWDVINLKFICIRRQNSHFNAKILYTFNILMETESSVYYNFFFYVVFT